MNSESKLLLATVALGLAGCAQDYSARVGRIDRHQFGEANRQTYAAMIIDPDPQYTSALPSSGEHAALAIERYRKDEVKQPERVSSSSTTGNGSGSSGSSSR